MRIIERGERPKRWPQDYDYSGVWTCLHCDTVVELDGTEPVKASWIGIDGRPRATLETRCPVCLQDQTFEKAKLPWWKGWF